MSLSTDLLQHKGLQMQSVQVLDEVPEGVGVGNVVCIRDIYVAAYLMWRKFEFLGAKRGHGGFQSAFYFKHVPESAILEYINGKNEAADLFQCFKAMRSFSSHVVVGEDAADA